MSLRVFRSRRDKITQLSLSKLFTQHPLVFWLKHVFANSSSSKIRHSLPCRICKITPSSEQSESCIPITYLGLSAISTTHWRNWILDYSVLLFSPDSRVFRFILQLASAVREYEKHRLSEEVVVFLSIAVTSPRKALSKAETWFSLFQLDSGWVRSTFFTNTWWPMWWREYVGDESLLGFVDLVGSVYKNVLYFVLIVFGCIFDIDFVYFWHGA